MVARVAERACAQTFREDRNYYERNPDATGGPAGSGQAFTAALGIYVGRFDLAKSTYIIGGHDGSPIFGWSFAIIDGEDTRAVVAAGGSVTTVDDVQAIKQANVGRFTTLLATYDGSLVRLKTRGRSVVSAAQGGNMDPSTNLTIGDLRNIGGPNFEDVGFPVAFLHVSYTALAEADFQAYEDSMAAAIEQGRDIPPPRGVGNTVIGQDWYLDARDVVVGGGGTRSEWFDRISNWRIDRAGRPEGGSYPGRMT